MKLFQHVVLPAVGTEGIDPVVFGEMAFFVGVEVGEELFHEDFGEVETVEGLVVVAPFLELLEVAEFLVVGYFFKAV